VEQNEKQFETMIDKMAELKDTSELMIDLAYSSLLFNSRELAEEVRALERRMDDLHTELELLILTRCVTPDEAKNYLGLIRLALAAENIADAAAQIADVVLRGLKPHPVLRLAIREAEETVLRVTVSEGSVLLGKSLKEAQIQEETGMWVLAVKRGDAWLRPKPDLVVKEGDILIAAGYAGGQEDLKQLASGKPTEA
jgi:uncharacterized protein with PhoU and TrkA domain